jgi:WD40 repeat protein
MSAERRSPSDESTENIIGEEFEELPTFLEFNESDSDGSIAQEDADDLGGSLTLAEMDLLFTEDDRAMFQRMEAKIEHDLEEWLDENIDDDTEKVIGTLVARDSQSRSYLNKLRKKRYVELGGKRKSRSLLMRYGITHTKIFRQAALLSLDCPQTYPRSVAHALLKRLRAPAASLTPTAKGEHAEELEGAARFEHLQRAFSYCVGHQRDEFETAKFELAHATPRAPVDADFSETSSTTSKASIKAEPAPLAGETNVRRRKPLAKPPPGLDEEHFVRGMARFFTILLLADRRGPALTVSRLRRKKRVPGEVLVVFDADESEILQVTQETAQWDSAQKQLSAEVASEKEDEELQRICAVHKSFASNADIYDIPVEPDFLELGPAAIATGFRLLFAAVDVNERGWITYEELVAFLLESSILPQVGESAAQRKEFEFMYSAHCQNTVDVSDAIYIKSRDLLAVSGTDIAFLSPDLRLSRRGVISSPTDPYTLSPLYRTSCIDYMPSTKTITAGFTDCFVRFFSTASLFRPKLLCQIRLDSTPLSMVVFRDVVYCGTRTGSLVSLILKYRDKGFVAVIRAEGTPHTDAISKIVPIPSENAVLSCSFDGTMALHDMKSLKTIFKFPKLHRQGIRDVAFLSALNTAVTIGFDGTILVWSINLIHQAPMPAVDHLLPHSSSLCSVCPIDQLASFATMDERGMIKIWDAQNITCLQTIHISHFSGVGDSGTKAVRMFARSEMPSNSSPLGLVQFYCFSKYRMYVFEYNNSQRPVILRNTADDDPILFVSYSHSERVYLTVTSRTTRVWNATTSTIRDTFRCWEAEENGGVTAATMNHNGRAYFLGCMSGSVMAKNLSTGATLHHSRHSHCTEVVAMQFALGAAGYGDVVFSVSLDCVALHTADFQVLFRLPNIESARCVEYDAQTMCLLVGDALGFVSVYLAGEITPGHCEPHVILQLPKKENLRPICCMSVLHGLSSFVAADEDGQLALFSLRHHPRPFSCLAIWNHVGDTPTMIPMVSAMFFSTPLFCLYCGDEMGMLTMYNLKEAIARGQSSASAVAVGNARNHLRREKSTRLAHDVSQSVRSSLSPLPSASFRSSAKNRTKHTVNLVVDAQTYLESHASIGSSVVVVNRWQAHEELVSSIFPVQPPPEAETAIEKHCVLLTASLDQCCYAWSNAGCKHLGALEQYQRCFIELTTFEQTNDLTKLESNRPQQLLRAKRDMVKLRAKGLTRKAGTHTFTIVPPWISAAAAAAKEADASSADGPDEEIRQFHVTTPPAATLMSVAELDALVNTRKRHHRSDTPPLSSADSSPRSSVHPHPKQAGRISILPFEARTIAGENPTEGARLTRGIFPSSVLVASPLAISNHEDAISRLVAHEGLRPKLTVPRCTSPKQYAEERLTLAEGSDVSGKSTPHANRSVTTISNPRELGPHDAALSAKTLSQTTATAPNIKDDSFGYHRGTLSVAMKGRKKLPTELETTGKSFPETNEDCGAKHCDKALSLSESRLVPTDAPLSLQLEIPLGSAYRAPFTLLKEFGPAMRKVLTRPNTSLRKKQPRYAVFTSHSELPDEALDDVPARHHSFSDPRYRRRSASAKQPTSSVEQIELSDPFTVELVRGSGACFAPSNLVEPSAASAAWIKSAALALRTFTNSNPVSLPEMPQRVHSAFAKRPKSRGPPL